MDRIRVLLAEDHEIVRAGIRMLLDAQPDIDVVAEASNGRSAVEDSLRLKPHVVILDISMPEMNGLAAAKAIKATAPQVQVLAR